jgi:hypothetical protein
MFIKRINPKIFNVPRFSTAAKALEIIIPLE